jgi:membrane protease YdiL (CAAX protease family)
MSDDRKPARCDWRAVGFYLLIAFFGSWLLAAAFRVLGGKLVGDMMSAAVGVPYMLMPTVAVLVVQKYVKREPVTGPLGVSFKLNWWWLAAWLGPMGFVSAVLGVSLLLPGVTFSWEMAGLFERFRDLLPADRIAQMRVALSRLPVHPLWLLLGQGLVAGVTINAAAGFGEELGWRGFLQREFAGLGFWRSSWLVGALWGVWHAPLVLQGLNYSQHPAWGVVLMTVWCTLMAPLFSLVRLRSGSVVAVSVMHGSFNAFAGLAAIMVTGGNDVLVGVTGLAGFIVLGILNLAILMFRAPRRLDNPGAPHII